MFRVIRRHQKQKGKMVLLGYLVTCGRSLRKSGNYSCGKPMTNIQSYIQFSLVVCLQTPQVVAYSCLVGTGGLRSYRYLYNPASISFSIGHLLVSFRHLVQYLIPIDSQMNPDRRSFPSLSCLSPLSGKD